MKHNKLLLTILFFGVAISFISINPASTTVSIVPDGYLEVYLYQGHHAAVGETGVMGFDIYSNFNVTMHVNISLIIMTPSDRLVTIYSQPAALSPWSNFYDEAGYTFTETGYYEVALFVYDEYGQEWKADCWWEVSDPWMDLWISQDNYASVGDMGYMAIDIYSHFTVNMSVSAKVVIKKPDNSEVILYDNPSVFIPAFGYWTDDVYYNFSMPGYYDVIFSISDGYSYWETHCWWEVFEEQEYLALWIYQDFHRMVGEHGWMDFNVENRFSVNKTVNILILMLRSDYEEVLINETVMIEAGMTWFQYIEYLFVEPGYYDVALLVTDHDTGRVWEFWCWWEVNDGSTGGYDLFIDQDYNAKVGETRWMHFKAQSNFAHDMPSVIIKIRMEDPTGYTELLLEVDVPINAYGIWEFDLNYTFTKVGMYIVHFELYDDIGSEWYTSCEWNVSEAGPSISVYGPDAVDVNETFVIEGQVYSGMEDELHIKKISLLWLNGTLIELIDVNQTFPVDSFFDVHFNLTIPIEGEFTFRIKADTNKGLLETKYSVKVGIIDDNTDDKTDPENKDTTPTLTPGFESIFGILALTIAIPIIRKSRK